jgi:hypothetical protein
LRQVEQDLVICRALCDLFNAPGLKGRIAFRGGTAVNKLLFRQPLRYSEDIDLVQVLGEPIGPTIDAIRQALAWLGKCNRDRAGHSTHLIFRFAPEVAPDTVLQLEGGNQYARARKFVRREDVSVRSRQWLASSQDGDRLLRT